MRKIRLLAISTLAILALILAACGGDPAPGSAEPQPERTTSQEATSINQPATPTLEPLPTRPTPLVNLGTSTPEPVRPTRARPTQLPTVTSDRTGTPPQPPKPGATAETSIQTSPLDLIPADPESNDTVLLQDIYELMDLDQFALDPTQPIEKFKTSDSFKFPRAILENHPYLFMFPDLELLTENTKSEQPNLSRWPNVIYSPYDSRIESVKGRGGGTHFAAIDPLTYFIYHPWFEDIHTDPQGIRGMRGLNQGRSRADRAGGTYTRNFYIRYGPYWFGKNSTRGILSDAIADMMKDAAYPTTHLVPLKWQMGGLGYNRDTEGNAVAEYNWKLDEYIRTTVARRSRGHKTGRISPSQERLKMQND